LVAAVTHPDGPGVSGQIFEAGAGYIAEIRWERSKGVFLKTDSTFTPSAVRFGFILLDTLIFLYLYSPPGETKIG
jgi:hypothetical protein